MKVLTVALLISFLLFPTVLGCKDVIVTGEATRDRCNLLLKVRDPSREGPQVIFIVNKGYRYSYHHPWTGKRINFEVERKFLGLATKGDIPPNIIKAGAALNDAGIAFGDADVPSYWINPTKYAWDDFDWLRYAYQSAKNEEEAVNLLEEVVKGLHAPKISENLFVVGPEKAYVIEADVVHFEAKEVKGICVMSNYPKELWKYRLLKRFFVASSFDETKEEKIEKGKVIRLGALFGIKIVKVEKERIYVKRIPFGEETAIEKNEGKVVGHFWVENKGNSIVVKYKYKEWEERIMEELESKYGNITVLDLMKISRLTSEDLDGLRGMSEGENRAAVIFHISKENPNLSCMWFAPDQCASIFVPVHLCSSFIYEPYTDGTAAELAKDLLKKYGYKGLLTFLQRVEKIFFEKVEEKEREGNETAISLLDFELQKQAYLMQKVLLHNETYKEKFEKIWEKDYETTLENMKNLYESTSDSYIKSLLSKIISSMEKVSNEDFSETLSTIK